MAPLTRLNKVCANVAFEMQLLQPYRCCLQIGADPFQNSIPMLSRDDLINPSD